MESLKYCVVCLSTNKRLYNANQHNLGFLYCDMIKVPISTTDSLKYFCFECAAILHKHDNFKSKCLHSQQILQDIHGTNQLITKKMILKIQNEYKLHTLTMSLSCDVIEMKYDSESSIKLEQNSVDNKNNLITISTDTKDDVDIYSPNIEHSDNESWDSDDDLTLHDAKQKKPIVRLKKHKANIEAPRSTKKLAKKKKKPMNTHSQEDKVKFLQQRSRALKMDMNKWKIVHLNEDEVLKEFMKVTETENYKNSMFHCDLCLKIFLTEDTLTRHMKVHSEAQGEHECRLCKKRFSFSSRLRKHMQDHTVRYHCLRCPAVIPNNKSSTYYTHVRETHRSRHVCARCGVSFVSEWGVNLHVKHSHWDEKSEATEQEKSAPQRETETHCAKCDITFTSMDAFNEHKRNSALHQDDDATNPTLLKTRRAAPRPPRALYVCEVCGARVALKYISQHRRVHARLQQPCSTCGKVFTSAKQQAIHTYKHTGVKPLACGVCARRFVLEHVLRVHMRRRHATVT